MTKSLSQSLARYWLLPSLIVALLSIAPTVSTQLVGNARVTSSFDSDWRFLKGDAPGAERPDFDDSAWRKLDVPHDWSIEGTFDEKNPTGGAGGFLPAGVRWGRAHFRLRADGLGQRGLIYFVAGLAHSRTLVNAFHPRQRPPR